MSKKTVGFTTGVYDMFHVGHLHLLKKAKRHCDYLIVGVSTDELVMQYKRKLPIIPLSDRLEIIESIGVVDECVVINHRDKIRQYHEIQYDLLFVGDDWKGTEIFCELERELKKNEAGIIYFNYTSRVSSTMFAEILQRIHSLDVP